VDGVVVLVVLVVAVVVVVAEVYCCSIKSGVIRIIIELVHKRYGNLADQLLPSISIMAFMVCVCVSVMCFKIVEGEERR